MTKLVFPRLHTRGYQNPDQLISALTNLGFDERSDMSQTLVANATFPMREFVSFIVQEENPSENMGRQRAESAQSYSERYASARGDSLTIPMYIAFMEYILKTKKDADFGEDAYLIKAPLFVGRPEGYASCLMWDPAQLFNQDEFTFVDTEDYHDVAEVDRNLCWISATNVQKKCC